MGVERKEKVACKFRKLPWCCNDGDMMIVIEIGYGFSILWVLIWL